MTRRISVEWTNRHGTRVHRQADSRYLADIIASIATQLDGAPVDLAEYDAGQRVVLATVHPVEAAA